MSPGTREVGGGRASPSLDARSGTAVDETLRLAIVQRVCTPYRVPLFNAISDVPGIRARVFHGSDLPGTKVRNADDFGALDHEELPTVVRPVAGRRWVWHHGLRRSLERFGPDVILAEGESNFPSYLQVLLHRRANPSVRTIHWSLGGLPGRGRTRGVRGAVARALRSQFDRFLVYSSFGRRCLEQEGLDPGRIHVAVNVSHSAGHLQSAANEESSPVEARRSLGLEEAFTVLYCGSFEPQKRPDLLLDLAGSPALSGIQFVAVGDGPLLAGLRERAAEAGLDNLHLPGRVVSTLPLYYRAADVLVVPGRGGMVISEAMAWELPVLVHQADGTEYDLIANELTGVRVGSVGEFEPWIRRLANDPGMARRWGRTGRARLEEAFTTEHMVDSILQAVRGP